MFMDTHLHRPKQELADILTGQENGNRQETTTWEKNAALYLDMLPSTPMVKRGTRKWLILSRINKPAMAEQRQKGMLSKRKNQKTCPPDQAKGLKMEISLSAGSGGRGNRRPPSRFKVRYQNNSWNNTSEEMREFLQSCIWCIIWPHGNWIPRPLEIMLYCQGIIEVTGMNLLHYNAKLEQ